MLRTVKPKHTVLLSETFELLNKFAVSVTEIRLLFLSGDVIYCDSEKFLLGIEHGRLSLAPSTLQYSVGQRV